jgi:signal transduction histidine kinase
MVLQILLIIAILLQLVAAVTAISLTRMTRYNLSWILFTVAFTAMCFLRVGEYARVVLGRGWRLPEEFFVWIGVGTSLCFAVGVFYVKKIFNLINRLDAQRRMTEKRILNTVVRTEEKERMRFSKELHDGLGPLLSSAKMSLSALSPASREGEDAQLIENVNYVIGEAIRSLREISNNLSPHVLNDFGLQRGIGNFIGKSLSAGSMKIDFVSDLDDRRFDTDVEVILYRVVCELINNSLKHSGGRNISISLLHGGENLTLDFADDGRGFNPRAVMDMGMGLQNINSRINSLKGSVKIESEKGRGMSAHIEVALPKESQWKRPEK